MRFEDEYEDDDEDDGHIARNAHLTVIPVLDHFRRTKYLLVKPVRKAVQSFGKILVDVPQKNPVARNQSHFRNAMAISPAPIAATVLMSSMFMILLRPI